MTTPSWDDIAVAIGTDTRQLSRWRKLPDAPRLQDVPIWLEWKARRAGAKLAAKADAEGVADDAALPGSCDYDDLVKGGKITYALAKVREQVISEKIANETRRVELDKARGQLVAKDDADRACTLVRDSITQRHDRAIVRALVSIPAIGAELRDEILTALQNELDAEA